MGCAEGRSPGACPEQSRRAGSLRACPEPAEGVSLRYKFFRLPDQSLS